MGTGRKRRGCSLVFRMVIAVTTMAMLGYRHVSTRSRDIPLFGRSLVTAFVTRTTRRTNTNAKFLDISQKNDGTARAIRLFSSRGSGYDEAGRRVRTPRPSSDSWGDDDDDWGQSSSPRRSGNRDSRSSRDSGRRDNSWDDFDPWDEPQQQQRQQQRKRKSYDYDDDDDDNWGAPRTQSSGRKRFDDFDDNGWDAPRDRSRRDQRGGRGRGGRGRGGRGGDRGRGGRGGRGNARKGKGAKDDASSRSINLNALEGAGFVHLYGLSSVLNALATGRRDLETSMEKSESIDDSRFDELDDGWDDNDGFDAPPRSTRSENIKPQAQFKPYLFVQERRSSGSERRGSKASAAQEVLKLAEERGVPIAHVDKGILNVLSGNRPHQGFALRCGKLYFESLSRIPLPTNARDGSDESKTSSPAMWLVLDEVVDPQNLGALLRSAYFLGGTKSENNNMGILVCSKNSAPPSPVVSASSAGALEVVDVHSTSNLPRTLNQAREDGFRIIGASASVPSTNAGTTEDDLSPPLYDLQDLPIRDPHGDDRPILLVLGSEGHGLRTLVAKACTEFVRIPSGMGGPDLVDDEDADKSEAGVDSLNVSVSAGIMMWHLLHGSGGK